MRVLRDAIHDHYPKAWSRYGFVECLQPIDRLVRTLT